MYFDCALYIITPMVVGFVGERYKNMKTIKYAVFISCVLLTDLIMIAIVDGGFFVPLKFALLLCGPVVLFATFLFHMQKRSRGVK